MSIKFDNYSRQLGSGGKGQYYEWRTFIDEPSDVLGQIESVEYMLHSSFPESYQVRLDATDHFALETKGWGEFVLAIIVNYKTGKQERAKYQLVLDPEKKPWPSKSAS